MFHAVSYLQTQMTEGQVRRVLLAAALLEGALVSPRLLALCCMDVLWEAAQPGGLVAMDHLGSAVGMELG